MSSRQFEDILIEQGLVKSEELSAIHQTMKNAQLSLVTTLLTQGRVKEPFLLKALEKFYEIPAVDLKHYDIDHLALELIPREICEKYCLIPLQKAGATLLVAFSDPRQKNVVEELRQISKCRIQALVCTDLTIAQNIVRHYADIKSQTNTVNEIKNTNQTSDQVKLTSTHSQVLQNLFQDAINAKAKMIDFDLTQAEPVIYFRIDKKRMPYRNLVGVSTQDLFAKLVQISGLVMDSQLQVQSSQFNYKLVGQGDVHCKMIVIAQVDGAHIQLQIMSKKNEVLSLDLLGFDEDELRSIKNLQKNQQGLLFISGFANSGMYSLQQALIQELQLQHQNIVSIESNQVARIRGVSQFFIDDEKKRFQLLKQMSDIEFDQLFVSDIFNLEELKVLFKLVYDGRVLTAGIRASDAASALSKFVEMETPVYVINSLVYGIIGIKMLGRICEQCRVQVSVPQATLLQLGVPQNEVADFRVFKGRGCAHCQGSGLKGSVPVIETLMMNDKIREALLRGANAGQIRYVARESGMKSLRKNILAKINKGLTTIEELHFATTKEI